MISNNSSSTATPNDFLVGQISKLRALFFPELVRRPIVTAADINNSRSTNTTTTTTTVVECDSDVGFDVTFKNCSCAEIVCDINYTVNR